MTIGHSTIIYSPYLSFIQQLKERGRFKYTQEEKGVCWSICTIDFQPLKIADELFRLSVTHRSPLDVEDLDSKKDKNTYLFSIRNSKNELVFKDVSLEDIEDRLQKIFESKTVTKN